jgi:hypothetical protein
MEVGSSSRVLTEIYAFQNQSMGSVNAKINGLERLILRIWRTKKLRVRSKHLNNRLAKDLLLSR